MLLHGQVSSTANSTFSVKCTKNTTYSFGLNYSQYGTDCSYLLGKNNGDKAYYAIFYNSVSLANAQSNNVSQSSTGNGSLQNFNFIGVIQSGLLNYSSCKSHPTNAGYNPYVTPDNYSDTVTFRISY